MSNRIAEHIIRMEAQIKDRIEKGVTTQEQCDKSHKSLDMNMEEHAMFQTVKSLAVANGLLSQEEGQTVYVALGETETVFNRQPLAVKYVLTGLFKELMTARMASKLSIGIPRQQSD